MDDLKIIVTSGGRNLDLGKRVRSLAEGMGKTSAIIELDDYEMPIYTRANKNEKLEHLRRLIQDLEGAAPWLSLIHI